EILHAKSRWRRTRWRAPSFRRMIESKEPGGRLDAPKNGESPESSAGGRRSGRVLAIKAAVSALLIYWILQTIDLKEVVRAVRTAYVPLLVTAFFLHFVGNILSVQRWRLLLKVHGVRLKFLFLVGSYMVGVFFNNFLPSTIGGDGMRAFDTW